MSSEQPQRRTQNKGRDIADQELAQEAEQQRGRVSRGLDGARKPEEKFPIEEAEDAIDPGERRG